MRNRIICQIPALCAAASVLLVGACSGGGGGGGDSSSAPPPPPPNAPPTADAGAAFSAREGESAVLSGTGTDDDGSIVAFEWRQVSGIAVSLAPSAGGASASFEVPAIDADSSATFELTVTDDDGDTGADRVDVEFLANFDLAGTVFAATGIDNDGDVNDPGTPLAPNDEFATAQPLANPVLLGGFVNQPGSGDERGQLRESGDVDDFYVIDAVAGQVVSLFIESERTFVNDLDLELYDADANLIDSSISITSFEQLTIPADGRFFVAVVAASGASNYILSIGQSGAAPTGWRAGALRLSDPFVTGQAIARFDEQRMSVAGGFAAVSGKTGLRPLGGAAGRSRLVDTTAYVASVDAGAGSKRYRALAKGGGSELQARIDTLMAVKAMRKREDVLHASPNYLRSTLLTPDDEFLSLQWHYPAISLPAAWDLTQGDPGVIVAVVDTGVLVDHPDLGAKLTAGFDFISNPTNSRDGDGIDADPDDPGDLASGGSSSFHGTHVAGTAGALTGNGLGVAGSGWNTRIMPLRALGRFGGSEFDINQAIRFAAGLENDSGTVPAQRADVINLSLGGTGFSQASQDLFDEVRAAGVVVVAAAGNSASSEPSFPAAYDGVISVSAVDINNERAGYSNFGTTIDLAAPGGDIGADVNGDGFGDGVLSTIGDDSGGGGISFGYGFLQGTSMAAPHVAGVLALMKAVDPALSPAAIDSLIVAGAIADDLGAAGRDDVFGHGLVNAFDAVLAAIDSAGGELPDPTPVLIATPPALNFGVSLTAQTVTVANGGTGDLVVNPPTLVPDVPWLQVDGSGADANGVGPYLLRVLREGLGQGTFQTDVVFSSNGGDFALPVIMQVSDPDTASGNAGNQFILLIDDATGEVVAQAEPGVVVDAAPFAFDDVVPGTYIIVGGTDNDADGFICDAAEACGAFPVLDPLALQTITIDGNEDGLDFVSTFNSELATPSGAAGEGDFAVASAVRQALGGRGIPTARGASVLTPGSAAADAPRPDRR